MANDVEFEIIKDFGSFGEGKWQKHLALVKWGTNDPKFDVRPWNDDMTKCGKGITLNDSEAYDLMTLIESALEGKGTDEGEDSGSDSDGYEDEDDFLVED